MSASCRTGPIDRIAFLLGFFMILLQRMGIPLGGGSIPVNVVIAMGLAVISVVGGRATLDGLKVMVFFFMAMVGVASLVASDAPPNGESLIQVLVMWSTWTLVTSSCAAGIGGQVLAGSITATLVCAFLGVFQAAVSIATGAFIDPFATIPDSLKVSGYNTTYGVGAIGAWDKANGMFFLEPSFLSLFCGIGIVMISERVVASSWSAALRLTACTVLAGGILASTALSGLVVLPFILYRVRESLRSVLVGVVLMGIGGFAVSRTPVFQAFAFRLQEDGSNQARLTRPYLELLPATAKGGGALIGHGPGSADVAVERLTAGVWEQEVTAPTLVKVAYEYGALGLLVLLLLIWLSVRRSDLSLPALGALVTALLVPTNALVNPVLTPLIGAVVPLSSHTRLLSGKAGLRVWQKDACRGRSRRRSTSSGLTARGPLSPLMWSK